jgi:hypothetical protein
VKDDPTAKLENISWSIDDEPLQESATGQAPKGKHEIHVIAVYQGKKLEYRGLSIRKETVEVVPHKDKND